MSVGTKPFPTPVENFLIQTLQLTKPTKPAPNRPENPKPPLDKAR